MRYKPRGRRNPLHSQQARSVLQALREVLQRLGTREVAGCVSCPFINLKLHISLLEFSMGITQKPVANGAVNLLIRPRDSSLLRRSFNLYDAIRIAGEQQRRILDASELNKFFSDPDRWGLKPNVARRAGPLVIYAGPNGFSENEFAWSFDRFGKPPM